jgi:hypothetical protein
MAFSGIVAATGMQKGFLSRLITKFLTVGFDIEGAIEQWNMGQWD